MNPFKLLLAFSFAALLIAGCKKDDAQPVATVPPVPTVAANTLVFDSTYQNVTMTSFTSGGKWQLNAVITIPGKTLALNVKFLQRPTANASFTVVTTEADVQATTAMMYINLLDANPTSYFLKSGTSGAITVSIASGKVSIQFSGLALAGNRGGADRTNVAANLTEY